VGNESTDEKQLAGALDARVKLEIFLYGIGGPAAAVFLLALALCTVGQKTSLLSTPMTVRGRHAGTSGSQRLDRVEIGGESVFFRGVLFSSLLPHTISAALLRSIASCGCSV
jgi:hypothetical protein